MAHNNVHDKRVLKMKRTILLASGVLALSTMAIHAPASEGVAESNTGASKLTADHSPGDKNHPQRRVTLENASVEVIELLYPAGSESALHSHTHPCRLIYALDAGELELLGADGQSQSVALTPGLTVFRVLDGPETHIVRNPGSTPIRTLEVELKDPLSCRR
jgi:mannose-6-phosphate isomerase-like protein (cupin superfamily)